MSSGISGISSLYNTQTESDQSQSISIPANLTPAEEAEVSQILGELSSGAITATQAQAQIAAISGSPQQNVQSGPQVSGAEHPHHGHHGEHKGNGPSATTLSSALDLTSDQESQIASIIQTAQTNGSSPATVLSQIQDVLTPAQQQQLTQLLSPTYSSTGTHGTGGQPPLFSTTA